jgi:ornithine--oxo-acid transaminase
MKTFKNLLQERFGENYSLHKKHVNPAFAKVLEIIGFNRVYTKGVGQYLWDDKDSRYLDFICGYGVFNLGRNHPKVREFLKEAMDYDYPNLVKMEAPLVSGLLAEKLLAKMPAGIDRVYFASSGSEAVESAIKFTRAATQRFKTLYLKGSYHGLTYGSLSITGDNHFQDGFGPCLAGSEVVQKYDLEELERKLSTREYSAFIFEPIQGKGVHFADQHYYTEMQRLCRQYGTYIVADEIQTGMGRTGKFLAIEHWGIQPDMVLLSKSLSGGYVPISCMMGKAEIFDKVYNSLDRCVVHSNTFSGNMMSMAAGIVTLDVMDEEKLVENCAKMGDKIVEGVNKLREKYELVKEIRGKGLLLAIEFHKPKSLALKIGWDLLHKADAGLFSQAIIMPLLDDHHILTQTGGHAMDSIKLSPALCINEDDVNYFLNALDKVLKDCHKFPGPVWEVGSKLVKHSLKSKFSPSTSA